MHVFDSRGLHDAPGNVLELLTAVHALVVIYSLNMNRYTI